MQRDQSNRDATTDRRGACVGSRAVHVEVWTNRLLFVEGAGDS
jgi:hypothetical protein